MDMYKPVPKVPDFPTMEREMLRFWEENRIFDKLREQNANGPRWSFLDGPITANNPMGVHHAWGRSLKDMYQRYHAMNGQAERYQNGFDCQGLWVEVEVEKSLGLKTKREIRDYGIEKFVRACKERVLTYAARQTEQSIRLGYWCDWDDPEVLIALRDALADGDRVVTVKLPSGRVETARASEIVRKLGSAEYGGSYFTFSDENNYTIWGFLKKCHDEGFIYRGHDVMPWCGRCGTGLSQMEVAEGRRITTHTSVFVRFPVKGQEKTALLVWTTTPWTLASNVAVAVNPEMTYLKVRHGDWTYYVAKANFERDRLQELQVEGKHEVHKLPSIRTILKGSGTIEVLEELPGSKLLGLTYTGPFDDLPAQNTPGGVFPYGQTGGGKTAAESHRVIAWKEISEAEGTGLVHIAPGCGAEDQELGRENNLPFIAPLDESSVFQDGFGPLTGRNANEVSDEVIAALESLGAARGPRTLSPRLPALLALQVGARLPPGRRMVYPHGLARPHRAHRADHPLDSARGRSPRTRLAAQHARLDDLEEALLGARTAHLGLQRVRTLHGHRQSRGIEGSGRRRLGYVRGQFAASPVHRCGQDSL